VIADDILIASGVLIVGCAITPSCRGAIGDGVRSAADALTGAIDIVISSVSSPKLEAPSGGVIQAPGNPVPRTAPPGSTVQGGTKSRTYGEDGYPHIDREFGHSDEKGVGSGEHPHDWGRPEGGGRPTNADRGPPRPPRPGDPPSPRGPNVPPPKPTVLPPKPTTPLPTG
jgi:hypothetical protein